jgi:hypothetical protein
MEADDSPTGTGRRVLITGAVAAMGVGAGVAAAKITDEEDDSSASEGSFTVVDRRGKQRFLLGTSKPPIIFGGKTYPAGERQGPESASYLIFNDENGDEKGGIIAATDGALVSLDYPNGDGIHLQTQWRDKTGGAGLVMKHMGDPDTPLEQAKHPTGVVLAADTENGAALTLCDPQGRPRIELRVSMDGAPSIAMLDEQGTVIKQL